MTAKRVLFTIVVISGFLAHTAAAQPADSFSERLHIQSLLELQSSAWNRGDIKGYMEGYWKSDSLLFTSGGAIQRGWQATLEKYQKKYSSPSKMGTLVFSRLEITQLSSESAWVFGHWELKRASDHPHGVFTLILKKFPGGWKIIHDHTSSSE